MNFRRKCGICNFIGMDNLFFIKSKKICDICFDSKEKEKDFKRKETKLKRKEYLSEYYKNWYQNNKESQKEYQKEWRKNNKDKVESYKIDYYIKNKEYINNRLNEYNKRRRSIDKLFKFKGNLRNLIKNSLIKQGYSKKSKTYEIVGISYEEFLLYIESKFQEGMSWENYGDWHLDHIIPISLASSENEVILLSNYKNFQPLWKLDNLRKSNKL